MLYLTTRNRHDAYTTARVLIADRGPDGGLYMPFRMAVLSGEEVWQLKDKTFSQCIAEILNLFFGCGLSMWDVEFAVGRYPFKTVSVSQKVHVAQLWHNQDGKYSWLEATLARKICGQIPAEGIPSWVRIAIRIAVLTAVFGELMRQGAVDPRDPVDIAVPAGDFEMPVSVWYARQMGLPIANIICSCNENSAAWELLHLATVRTDSGMPEQLERLICGTLGPEEACRYAAACEKGGVYALSSEDAEKLRAGMFAAVVSAHRLQSTVRNVYRTSAYIPGPQTALAYGGLLDYRAKTGENRTVLLLAQTDPADDAKFVADALDITVSELKEKLN